MCVRQRSLCVFSLFSPSSSRSYRHYKCLHHMHIHTYIHHDRGNIYIYVWVCCQKRLTFYFLLISVLLYNQRLYRNCSVEFTETTTPHTSLDYPENGSSLILYNLYNLDMHMKHRTPTHTHPTTHTRTVYNANACMYTWNVHIFNMSLYLSRLFLFLSLSFSLSVFLFSFVCNLFVHFRSSDQHLIV